MENGDQKEKTMDVVCLSRKSFVSFECEVSVMYASSSSSMAFTLSNSFVNFHTIEQGF